MFYWLHYTTANVSLYTEKPLLIWLEGGPGISSTGYTNFKEIGPLTLNLTSRSNSLVKDYNILLIDSPVGTGFSYVNSSNDLPKTEKQVVQDLLTLIEHLFIKFPNLSKVQTYIVGQCYGGKIAATLAYEWIRKIENGWNFTNLKGIGLISAWISPVDSVLTWGSYLYHNGLVDKEGYKAIMDLAKQTKLSAKMKDWNGAHELMQSTIRAIEKYTGNVNFYNILSKMKNDHHRFDPYAKDEVIIKNLMESRVKSALNLPNGSYFNLESTPIYKRLAGKLMKPVTKKVEYLLNQPNFKVFVCNGQFDLVIDTPGTLQWISNLFWKDSTKWLAANREPLLINGFIEGYVKGYGNLKMYWVNRAGHVITIDNPTAIRKVLHNLTSNDLPVITTDDFSNLDIIKL
ncbi:retinoid-inducible serine carboxypeptidase-like isoform X2 [Leptopilina boulardi]|nr:retinoid-inducible serine carboxypeptidase-like isoform X2 [Leptopilina boulardi]